jgi:sulfite exporter TauE/SafE
MGNVSSPTLGISFLIGLTAGVSSCMALIGGLVLGVSAKWNQEHSDNSTFARFAPHLYFHLGRILGFGLLGGILGLFGSVIHFSNVFLGVMTLIVGVIMVLLGLNLTNLSPRLGSFSFKLPKFLGKHVNGEGTGEISVFLTGMATFFLPCGFTLAMQAYAVSTGNFMTGAMSMALFALGTVPGLLSIGFVSSVLRGNWLKKFFAFTGVVVLAL